MNIKKIPKKIQNEAVKRTVDGIIDILLKLYETRSEDESALSLDEFLIKIKEMDVDTFIERRYE